MTPRIILKLQAMFKNSGQHLILSAHKNTLPFKSRVNNKKKKKKKEHWPEKKCYHRTDEKFDQTLLYE